MGSGNFPVILALTAIHFVSFSTGQRQQEHQLKFVNAGQTPSDVYTPQFNSTTTPDSELRNTSTKFSEAERICVTGMWALYNTTNYGEGVDDVTSVISMRGTNINGCSRPGQFPGLRDVRSLRFLGNANYSRDAIVIFSQPHFLGGVWKIEGGPGSDILPPSITGFALGSFAITGSKAWLLCRDTEDPCGAGICVDMRRRNRLYYVNDPERDSSLPSGSGGWPSTVRRVQIISTLDDCPDYPGPVIQQTESFSQVSPPDAVAEVGRRAKGSF